MTHNAELEALLYAAGDEGIDLGVLAQLLDQDNSAVRQQLEQYQAELDGSPERGLTLLQAEDHYKLVTKKELAPLLKRYFAGPQSTNLSQAALEVLAIIAYRQPLTRIEIDEIRGVQSSGAIQTLLLRRLIEEAGRKDAPGRPILYQTSAFFLDYFDLKSLKNLPAIDQFKQEQPAAEEGLDLFYNQFSQALGQETSGEEDNDDE
ncbi:segregation and condensation protein B [Lactobacillus selangorensis]|uniref:Segregation and condensation protein B n=1 Tax=Lactobacillus selangorensis TaxID=81857 RepID=A0A0R2GB40_9LACO|nr:SMC-Scp complex subunit ScpB [Lactobacillus selangorensis]KRN29435.1 segregation and condensation protein B [Lactobacillus selangorensis]KRN34036.1 segregation and condensation protein B [Lactobacillus selangorensis]